jgi:inactivated superfamily I helicase
MVIEGLGRLLSGRRRVSPEEREQVLAYYRQSLGITALQTREADRYNSVLVIHLNNLDNPDSVRALVETSARLALCAKECIRRHSQITSVPDLAGEDYATWSMVHMEYSNWAEASHDTFVAISQSLTPAVARVQELFDISEKRRKAREESGKKLLRSIGFAASDLPGLMAASQQAMDTVDWEPPAA